MLLRAERRRKLDNIRFNALKYEDYDYKDEIEKLTFYSLENPPKVEENEMTLLNQVAFFAFLIALVYFILNEPCKNDLLLNECIWKE